MKEAPRAGPTFPYSTQLSNCYGEFRPAQAQLVSVQGEEKNRVKSDTLLLLRAASACTVEKCHIHNRPVEKNKNVTSTSKRYGSIDLSRAQLQRTE